MSQFSSVAALKVAYLKNLKYTYWHRQRLASHLRAQLFNTNEYLGFVPSKKAGRKLLQERLKGPILESFYDDNDDRVLYSRTKNRKSNMQAITEYEQQTLFPYRRKKKDYWKLKTQIQAGKKRLASKLPKIGDPTWPRPYAHRPDHLPKKQNKNSNIKKIAHTNFGYTTKNDYIKLFHNQLYKKNKFIFFFTFRCRVSNHKFCQNKKLRDFSRFFVLKCSFS
ncbi:hypothetical protein RFI_26381 [Reticulomyxa filosa]|uniref:Uncharacterized protein n=1 Tax=Reticulomyxa filosa TaxID=46433 RepID=X6MC30_RETFI|nr:hypothetical protein RFI_26381 [Reticulomyxa filosa]|eukprot:ETO10997.1 hypothetical protein RFI_26381 [Reticulomyxa filosa]